MGDHGESDAGLVVSYEVTWPGFPHHALRCQLRFSSRSLLLDFSLAHVLEVSPGVWSDVARVDCRHGEVHFHQFSRTGAEISRRVIRPIEEEHDVPYSWDEAYDLMHDGRHEAVRRWRYGR